jgi:alcohol dehydrogenase class IV
MNVSFFRTAQELIVGTGALSRLEEKVRELGANTVLVITDRGVRQVGLTAVVEAPLRRAGLAVDVFDDVMPEPPFENLLDLLGKAKGKAYDLVIGIGGGSAMDIAKVLAVLLTNGDTDVYDMIGIERVNRPGIPFILIPTTAGTGSEVTYNAIFTDTRDQVKKGIVSKHLLPKVAIVDPALTLSLPPAVTAATGMDALVHAVESYTALRASDLTDGIALHAIRLISRHLRTAVHNGQNLEARENMAVGSLMAGISLANAGVGAVHALAYPLGGRFKVPHGVANSLLLPYVMRYNVVADLPKFAEVARAMGEPVEGLSLRDAAERTVQALARLARDIGIPSSLKDVGVTERDIPSLAEEAGKIDRLLNNNPRRLTLQDIEDIYRAAYAGA